MKSLTLLIAHWRTFAIVSVLGALVATAISASGLFSDQDTVPGNSLSAGTISLDAREVANKPISASNMLPGESTIGTVDLFNDGSREQRQYMHIENLSGGGLCDYLDIKLGYAFVSPDTFDVVFGTQALGDITGATDRVEVGRDSENGNPVPAGNTTRLVQEITVDLGAPNSVQGESCTWDEVFTAEQVTP